jgi:hypothetical protein
MTTIPMIAGILSESIVLTMLPLTSLSLVLSLRIDYTTFLAKLLVATN